ncbi:Uncharacterized protein TCM_008706 [Theobroma cacao]|uniref:Uncharacterized protein n=1 Tax=Theobroma cacao TaxID=3641 RepID=A0A061E615_THECC|nr:Uncharacterized protein TCM_008706 [Theobroma cacao]
MPNTRMNRNFSTFWEKIVSPLFPTNNFFLQVTFNLSFVTSNRENLHFWIDEWIEGFHLVKLFPRIYVFLVNKWQSG